MMTDRFVTAWYDLFLDLWNQRNRLEQTSLRALVSLSEEHGGQPMSCEEPSVIVTSFLLIIRTELVALDRLARDEGDLSEDAVQRLRVQARQIHDRWAERFRNAIQTLQPTY